MRGDCIVPRVDAETPWEIGLDREEVELLLQGIPDRPPAPALGSSGRMRIRVDGTKPFVDEPRFTTVRTVYQPTADELARAAKS